MLENMPKELKTWAYVLRRTNYGEADRILNLITPVGKISAIAKGVRKPRSKLAGGVEMFSLSEVNLHFGKSEMAVVTGARMVRFYTEILKDLTRMEMAVEILKKINKAAEGVDASGFFEITDKCLFMLNDGCDIGLVEAWFMINLAKVMGEEINLYLDSDGDKLEVELKYSWDAHEKVLVKNDSGEVDANMIKILRMMVSADFEVVRRVIGVETYVPEILKITRTFGII